VDVKAPTINAEEALNEALAHRPEVQQSEIARSINELNQRFYSDQKRPQIDLVAHYSLDGLAGSVNPLSSQDPIAFASTDLTNRVNELSVLAGLPPLTPPAKPPPAPPINPPGEHRHRSAISYRRVRSIAK